MRMDIYERLINMDKNNIYQLISKKMQDDESKSIFENRIRYSIQNSNEAIKSIIETTETACWLEKILSQHKSEDILLYGAGRVSQYILNYCAERVCAIVDQDINKQGKLLMGIPVISLQKAISKYRKPYFLISVKNNVEEIIKTLMRAKIAQRQIGCFYAHYFEMRQNQYFDLPYLLPGKDEVFVDCGAYHGETSEQFIKWCGGKYKHIYCFEPDRNNLALCRKNLLDKVTRKHYTVINKGTWSGDGNLAFSDSSDETSHIIEKGEKRIEVCSLDEELFEKRKETVTFIKMDIEGAELESLKGARKIIQEQKPKLAICVYHKKEDIFDIPEYILSLNSEYKLYLRHYTLDEWDTVLYAIP